MSLLDSCKRSGPLRRTSQPPSAVVARLVHVVGHFWLCVQPDVHLSRLRDYRIILCQRGAIHASQGRRCAIREEVRTEQTDPDFSFLLPRPRVSCDDPRTADHLSAGHACRVLMCAARVNTWSGGRIYFRSSKAIWCHRKSCFIQPCLVRDFRETKSMKAPALRYENHCPCLGAPNKNQLM